MRKLFPLLTLFFLIGSILFWVLDGIYDKDVFFSFAITFTTFFFHFFIRIFFGVLTSFLKPNPESKWFRERKFEKKFFLLLRVKKWKGKILTYDSRLFDPSLDPDTLLGNSMRACLCHELIIPFSYIPLFFTFLTNSFFFFFLFLGTSFLASFIDLVSIIVQRYNIPRIKRIRERKRKASCFPSNENA